MTIEEQIFANYSASEEKLREYGFLPREDSLMYAKALPKDNLKISVEYDGAFRGKIVDLATGDEYTNFRRVGATGYSAAIREQFSLLLLDIRQKCCRNQYFRSGQARRISNFIRTPTAARRNFSGRTFPPTPRSVERKAGSGTRSSAACRCSR